MHRKGFSLAEVMIYTALVGVAGVFLNQTLLSVLKLQNSQDASTEVNQQIDFVLKNIQEQVRNSSEIDTDANVATTTLKLRMADPALDPTTIYTSGTTIYMKKGTASPLALTNDKVNADQLQFTKITAYPGHDSVQTNLSLSYNTTNTQSAFTKTITSAVARVNAATFDADIVPGTDNTYSVGQTSARWQNLLLSGGAGIGVTSLANSLDVNGGAAFGTFAGANTAPTGGLVVSGQVGIGTANPGAIGATGLSYSYSPALEVNGTGSIGAVVSIVGANSSELDFIHSGGALNTKQIFLRQANQKLEFSSTDDAGNYKHANILEVDGNQGYVGIGTTSPAYKLDISGGSLSVTNNANNPQVRAVDGSIITKLQSVSVGGTEGAIGTESQNDLAFITNNATKMFIQNSTGNVGIGTTSPATKLDVNGTITSESGGFTFPDGTTQTTASTGGSGSSIAENGSNYFSSPAGTSRACSTVYTNNTSKPIFVALATDTMSNGNVVSGFIAYLGTPSAPTTPTYPVQYSVMVNNGGASGDHASAFFIVPPGYAYQVSITSGYGICPSYWTEYQ